MLHPLHPPNTGVLRVVALLSGSGSNLRRILEHERRLRAEEGRSPYEVVVLFTDNAESRAVEIGRDFDLPVLVRDLGAYYAARNKPRKDMELRAEYDAETVRALKAFAPHALAYAGYMSIATPVLTTAFLGVNVHPADLSILDEHGARRYVGAHAIRMAIRAGATQLHSTTHIVEPVVDGGRLLMISPGVPVEFPAGLDPHNAENEKTIVAHNQERLKEHGDWVIFPQTLEALARGRYAADETGLLHFDGLPIPNGQRL